MRWKNGTCYQGDWLNGVQHGYGRLTAPDGRECKEGYFQNNEFKVRIKIEKSPVRVRH